MDQERQAQHNRLTNPHRSKSAKIGWKRYRSNYMRAARKKERDSMNKSFYSLSKEIAEALSEAKIEKDNVFKLNSEILFENISGGIAISINDGNISISTLLNENGQGNYKLLNTPQEEDAYKNLYNDLKDELFEICKYVDQNIKQVLAKHGLRET